MNFKKSECLIAVVIALLAFSGLFAISKARAEASLTDFAQYWTACKLFRSGPFDIAAENKAQINLAAYRHDLLIMRNPPWTALVFYPLSLLSYPNASALWIVISVSLVFCSTLYFWRKLGGTDDLVALVIAFAFAPTFVLLDLAQITSLILAGAALFLCAVQGRKYWLAGVALFPFTFKPHLTFIFLALVFVWSLTRRHWSLITSFTGMLAAAVALCYALNPHIGVQYVKFAKLIVDSNELYPTVSGEMAAVTGLPILKFLPPLLGLGFMMVRYAMAKDWDWQKELPLLLSICVASSFYSYPYDQVLAIPLLLLAVIQGNKYVFTVLFLAVNFAMFFYLKGPRVGLTYLFLWWTASAWTAIYYVTTYPSMFWFMKVRPVPQKI